MKVGDVIYSQLLSEFYFVKSFKRGLDSCFVGVATLVKHDGVEHLYPVRLAFGGGDKHILQFDECLGFVAVEHKEILKALRAVRYHV